MTTAGEPSTYVEVDVRAPEQAGAAIERVFDRIADALHAATVSGDADLAVNLATEVLTFCVTFPGPLDPEKALGDSLAIARNAIHSAGLDPAAWEVTRASVQPVGGHRPMLLTA